MIDTQQQQEEIKSEQHSFIAKVKTKGKQQTKDGWAMVLDWRFPDSHYDLTLYGQDWETVQDVVVDEKGHGPLYSFTIQQGQFKKNKDGTIKDGKYLTDYFWNMVSVEPAKAVAEAVAEVPDVASRPESPARIQAPPSELTPNPAALGACHNHAVDFIVSDILPLPEGRELIGWIRELRDRFYREINQAPLAPLHYCYAHNKERSEGKSKAGNLLWTHQNEDEDSYCVEGPEEQAPPQENGDNPEDERIMRSSDFWKDMKARKIKPEEVSSLLGGVTPEEYMEKNRCGWTRVQHEVLAEIEHEQRQDNQEAP
tara:strand:+ start:725 stop:1660 length:936 start_codon:yes stop_codon:yes gene_type:complete